MATIIPYDRVHARMTSAGFESLYYNSGAFGFPKGQIVHIVGWIGPDDPSVRDDMRPHIQRVPEPYPQTLAKHVRTAWEKLLPGNVWLMPKSHWAYELDFGNRDWLPTALADVNVDAAVLQPLTNGSAIEFDASDGDALERFLARLFQHLHGSDFMLAFPDRAALCTLHHHQQAWWQTNREDIAEKLRSHLTAT